MIYGFFLRFFRAGTSSTVSARRMVYLGHVSPTASNVVRRYYQQRYTFRLMWVADMLSVPSTLKWCKKFKSVNTG